MAASFTHKIGATIGAVALAFSLVACSSESEGDANVIKVGTSPGPYSELFKDGIDPILTEQGYTLEYTNFSDLQQADIAVDEGSVDLNVDQHTAYMEVFNRERDGNLASLVEIPTVPAKLYSDSHSSLDDVAEGQTVGIPLDASNQSRAFNILVKAGWITLKEGHDPIQITVNDIADNPHDLEIMPMDSATIPRSLQDLDWGVIPGSISYSSGVDAELALLDEDLRPELILVAVTTEDKQDSEWAQAVTDAYQSDEFAAFLDEENSNGYWFVPEYN